MRWVERQKSFIDYTLSSLCRRKGKNISLLLVYAFIVFLVSSVMFFTDALKKEARQLLHGAPEVLVQRMVAGRHDYIPLGYTEKIRNVRGVRKVEPRLWGYYYHPAARATYTAVVPPDFPHPHGDIEVGKGVMRTWGTVEDGSLHFRGYDGRPIKMRVAKTFEADSELVTSDLILMSENAFRAVLGTPKGTVTDIAVQVANKRESATVVEKILLALPDTRVITRDEILRTYASLFDWRSGYMIMLLMGALLAFLIFAWDRSAGLAGPERSEIGVLKALGWDTHDILVMKFWEGMVVSLSAFLLGVVAAYAHVFFSSARLFRHALQGWSVLYPVFSLSPSVSLYELAILFFLTVVPYSLSTVVPVWHTAITDPDVVMRQS